MLATAKACMFRVKAEEYTKWVQVSAHITAQRNAGSADSQCKVLVMCICTDEPERANAVDIEPHIAKDLVLSV